MAAGTVRASRWRRLGLGLVVGVVLVVGGAFVLEFDRGPLWTARVVGTRDALVDMVKGTPHVLVVGDPTGRSQSAAGLEARLGARGLSVRYTGDDRMSDWERRYVAAYWGLMGLVHDLPTG